MRKSYDVHAIRDGEISDANASTISQSQLIFKKHI